MLSCEAPVYRQVERALCNVKLPKKGSPTGNPFFLFWVVANLLSDILAQKIIPIGYIIGIYYNLKVVLQV